MGRASVWVTTNTGNVGAIAPSTDAAVPARRPPRWPAPATDAVGEERRRQGDHDPGRTKAPAMPMPESSTPKSSAAKLSGLGEERVGERRRHRGRAEQAEHERLRSSIQSRVVPTTARQDRRHRRRLRGHRRTEPEQPTEPGIASRYRCARAVRPSSSLRATGVLLERTFELVKRAVMGQLLGQQVVARGRRR